MTGAMRSGEWVVLDSLEEAEACVTERLNPVAEAACRAPRAALFARSCGCRVRRVPGLALMPEADADLQ